MRGVIEKEEGLQGKKEKEKGDPGGPCVLPALRVNCIMLLLVYLPLLLILYHLLHYSL